MYTSTKDNPIFHCPSRPMVMESRWKSNIESAPNCPRCASSNTKFCYYNNYSLSQPRYFCKGCRRYWTKGGSLRNVPVGGGCRKSRRARSARQAGRSDSTYGMPGSIEGHATTESNSTTDGVNIDLAAVFAKFLNQDSSKSDDTAEIDEASTRGAHSSPSDLPPTSLDGENRLENFMLESQILPSNLIDTGLPQMCLDVENVGEFLDHNCNALELQAILGDGIVGEEVPWSDCWSFPNNGVQSHLQFEEFGVLSSDDEAKIASNPSCDHWNYPDLSAYEIFSSP